MSTYSRRRMLELSLAGALGACGATQAAGSESASQPAPSPDESPADAPIKTRFFWTWDHSTQWVLNVGGAQTLGASNPYGRKTIRKGTCRAEFRLDNHISLDVYEAELPVYLDRKQDAGVLQFGRFLSLNRYFFAIPVDISPLAI